MLNVQAILNQLNVNPQMQSKVITAWQTATQMAEGVQTKEQALGVLKQNGVNKSNMQKISGYLNHPLAGVAASMAGVNINKIRADFNVLMDLMGSDGSQAPISGTTKITQIPTNGNDSLDKYKQGLRQL